GSARGQSRCGGGGGVPASLRACGRRSVGRERVRRGDFTARRRNGRRVDRRPRAGPGWAGARRAGGHAARRSVRLERGGAAPAGRLARRAHADGRTPPAAAAGAQSPLRRTGRHMNAVGRVTLVGAGPGSADLITVRGANRLAEADLVLYDALSSEEMRVYAPNARWFFVGKRACRQSIGQDVLNRLLVRYARRGLKVVRLKCGDPFVFGRGGEECLALAEAGIPFEVVPGVSSSVAAPALAGIPVTHRGLASSFLVVTGHHEATYAPILDQLPPQTATLVVMMGLGQRARIAERLIARGWPASTPAAVVVGAATPQSARWIGTLVGLAAELGSNSVSTLPQQHKGQS